MSAGAYGPVTVSLINPVSIRIDHLLHTLWKALADTAHIIVPVDVAADVPKTACKFFGCLVPGDRVRPGATPLADHSPFGDSTSWI